MRIRIVVAAVVCAALSLMPTGAPAAPTAQGLQQESLSATVHLSVTILPSATVGLNGSGRNAIVLARGYDGRVLTGSDVTIVFTDARGDRVISGPSDLDRALRQAERSGDDHVDVTFVF